MISESTAHTADAYTAVCVRCGEDKRRALEACASCGYVPKNETSIALSIVLSAEYSSPEELQARAMDIRSGRRWAPPVATLGKARIVAQSYLSQPTAAHQTRGVSSTPGSTTVLSGTFRTPIVPFFASNPFPVLGATPRDSRRRLAELAEGRALSDSSELVSAARTQITHPRARLSAEVGWLPGVSPTRSKDLLDLVSGTPDRVFGLEGLPPMAHANLMAGAFTLLGDQPNEQPWSSWLSRFAKVIDEIDPAGLQRSIDEDRGVAGFPLIVSPDWIDAELDDRRIAFKAAVREWLDRLPAAELLQVLTDTADLSTQNGTVHAPRLIEELIADFEHSAQAALTKAETAIDQVIAHIRAIPNPTEVGLGASLNELARCTRNWDRLAQPAQLCAKARGEEHAPSQAIASRVRSVGVDLANNHSLLGVAERLTALLQEVFAEVPEVVETVSSDAATIKGLQEQKKNAAGAREAFEKEITYNASVGMVFKTRLAVSPQGLEWGDTRFALESITRVGWGAVRHSINGISTGTTYHILFGDSSGLANVETRQEEVFETFTNKLWKAVCVRLLLQYAQGLKAGKEYRFGDILVSDVGCELTLHKFLGSDRVRVPWSDIHIWSADGSFVVGMKSNKKTYGTASYRDANNAHILESMIRIFFKDPNAQRPSQALID